MSRKSERTMSRGETLHSQCDCCEHAAERIEKLRAENAELKSVLSHLRERDGECIGDNPKWIEKIDRLLRDA